jgi:hypothetical protein
MIILILLKTLDKTIRCFNFVSKCRAVLLGFLREKALGLPDEILNFEYVVRNSDLDCTENKYKYTGDGKRHSDIEHVHREFFPPFPTIHTYTDR